MFALYSFSFWSEKRDRKSPQQIYALLTESMTENQEKIRMANYLKRFLSLWQRNQWKRERYAPGFHIDDESLDPKSSCRYPILSGCFEKEFEALQGILET